MQILYAVDGSVGAAAAGRFLAELKLGFDVSITILTVATDGGHDAAEALDRAAVALGASPARLREVIRHGHAAEEIIREAEDSAADLIVLGSHGRSAVARFLLGSVAEQVARQAPCPVLLVREAEDGPRLRRVILGVDGPDSAAAAAECLKRFPLPFGCEVRLVSILANQDEIARAHLRVNPPLAEKSAPFDQWLRDQTAMHLAALVDRFAASGTRVVTEIRSGDPAQGLLDVARDEGADLIVVGSHGRGVLEQFLLGSVSQQVLRHAPCSVLVVRHPAHS
ncbi:MAG: universal stress protein [Actinomycetota bacterium]